jgi:hypothetical protein
MPSSSVKVRRTRAPLFVPASTRCGTERVRWLSPQSLAALIASAETGDARRREVGLQREITEDFFVQMLLAKERPDFLTLEAYTHI